MTTLRDVRALLALTQAAYARHAGEGHIEPRSAAPRKSSAEAAIHATADEHLPAVKSAVIAAMKASRAVIDLPMLQRAIATKDQQLAETATLAVPSAFKAKLTALLPAVLQAALIAGGDTGAQLLSHTVRTAASNLRHAAKKPDEFEFDPEDELVQAWIEEHAAELSDQLANTTEEEIASALEDAFDAGELNDLEETIVGIAEDADRSAIIAMNEVMTAVNEGQRQAWSQATDEGYLTGNEVRQWNTADSSACPECDDLDGETAAMDESYPGDVYSPPLHPNCRCFEVLVSQPAPRSAGDNPGHEFHGNQYVYHGTAASNLASIKQHGLRPNEHGNPINFHHVEASSRDYAAYDALDRPQEGVLFRVKRSDLPKDARYDPLTERSWTATPVLPDVIEVEHDGAWKPLRTAGDKPGHEFHGNQWLTGASTENERAYADALKRSDAYFAKQPEATQQALGYYVNGDSHFVNTHIAGGDTTGLANELNANDAVAIKRLVDKAPAFTSPLTVYHGFSGPDMATLKVGDTFTTKGLLSTSVDPVRAARFGLVGSLSRGRENTSTMLEIEAKHGLVIPTELIDESIDEREVLLPHGARYDVMSVRQQPVLMPADDRKDAAPRDTTIYQLREKVAAKRTRGAAGVLQNDTPVESDQPATSIAAFLQGHLQPANRLIETAVGIGRAASRHDSVDRWALGMALAAGDHEVAIKIVNDVTANVRAAVERAVTDQLRDAGDKDGHNFHGNQWTTRESSTVVSTVSEAIPLILAGHVVELKNVHKVNTLLTKLAAISKEAVRRGEHAPNYDACKITVAGASVFCGGSLRTKEYPNGMPRVIMPQLNGIPRPGSRAAKLPTDDEGRVDIGPEFMDHLTAMGISSKSEHVLASHLMASQNELIGPVIAKRVAKDQYTPAGPIFISRDNYVVDGHHRWAAVVGRDASDGKLGNLRIRAIRVDAPISELLHIAKRWSVKFGLYGSAATLKKPRTASEMLGQV